MGVDIALFLEVRHKKKWRAVRWKMPKELNSVEEPNAEDKEWDTHSYFFVCRYYHFRDFVEDHGRGGLPDDVSPEFREELGEYEMGTGYFAYADFSHFCTMKEKEMLDGMSHSAEHQMIKQLNRIERYVKQKPIAKTQLADKNGYAAMSVKQIYEQHDEEYGLFDHVRHIVDFLTRDCSIYSYADDIRIVYAIC